ncbi:MAG: carbohydrate kinase family protein [Chloroflexota bacterium]|nr:carbohydrate kinase family protein [Chloroflexota bacterium]
MHKTVMIGLGALNVDHLYRVDQIVTDGETAIQEYTKSPGGSAANTTYGLAKLGISSGFIGAVGDDEMGHMIKEDLVTIGIDTSRIITKQGEQTGMVLCLTDGKGRRALYASPGSNGLLQWNDIDITYLNQADLIHMSSFVDETQLEVQKRLASRLTHNTKLSFAPGAMYVSRGMDNLLPIMRRTDILFINEAELRDLTAYDIFDGAKACAKIGCNIIVITLGAGKLLADDKYYTCYIYTKDQDFFIEGLAIHNDNVVDTTGAGDAFAAGFLYGFILQHGLKSCGQFGNIVAASSIMQMGGRAGLPSLPSFHEEYTCYYGQPPEQH